VKSRPSPNHDARPEGGRIDTLVLHYTGMKSADEALERLCDPAAKVSAHYLIEEDGAVWSLVPEDRRAWHAGVASWRGATDINARSIGIELANPGHEFGYRAFPAAQIGALRALARDVRKRHAIPADNVVGHSDVAPLRKQDPGELFDWRALAAEGIGLWPAEQSTRPGAWIMEFGDKNEAVADMQRRFAAYGYGVPSTGVFDDTTFATVKAFQRHFRPRLVDGLADAETQGRLDDLLTQVGRRLG
jgi:N-acetylmuramoyl-L-alanine amidase